MLAFRYIATTCHIPSPHSPTVKVVRAEFVLNLAIWDCSSDHASTPLYSFYQYLVTEGILTLAVGPRLRLTINPYIARNTTDIMRCTIIIMLVLGMVSLAFAGPLQPASGTRAPVSTAEALQSPSPSEYQCLKTGLFQRSVWSLPFWLTHSSTPLTSSTTALKLNIPLKLILVLTLLTTMALTKRSHPVITVTETATVQQVTTTTQTTTSERTVTLPASTIPTSVPAEPVPTIRTSQADEGCSSSQTHDGKVWKQRCGYISATEGLGFRSDWICYSYVASPAARRFVVPKATLLWLTMLISVAFGWPAAKGVTAAMTAPDTVEPTTIGKLPAPTKTAAVEQTTADEQPAATVFSPDEPQSKTSTMATAVRHATTETLPASTVTVTVTNVGAPEKQKPDLPKYSDYEQGDSFPDFQDWILDFGEMAQDLIHILAVEMEHAIDGAVTLNAEGNDDNPASILGHVLKELVVDAEEGAHWGVGLLGQAIAEVISHDEWL